MTNPMVPEHYKAVQHAPVTLEKHVIVGCGSVILPGVTMFEGAAVGALSLINRDCKSFSIYAGQPARLIKARLPNLLILENQFKSGIASQ
jgi:dTDP-4-amino-4,6-dideoxy-D-glucose acyltransferase